MPLPPYVGGSTLWKLRWDELVVLFSSLGYVKKEMQGSRVRFFNAEINHTILMHRPHPESYIKGGTLKAIKQNLKEAGVL
ncbi:type II toxin-antitoxin system HicA family toxin [Escherichia coli]